MYEQQRIEAAAVFEKSKEVQPVQGIGMEEVEPVLDTQNMPYESDLKDKFGRPPPSKTCPYPVIIGDKPAKTCNEEEYQSDTYAVKYPETEEQKLAKYYDDVLRRHEEACMKAREYKKYHECLPGTVLKNEDRELSKKVLIGEQAKPQLHKVNPCKKAVCFAEPLEKCDENKDSICNLKQAEPCVNDEDDKYYVCNLKTNKDIKL